jgi:kynureninase
MKKGFKPMKGAAGWQLSNAQILPMAAHMAALDEIDFAGGMKEISALTKELVEPLLQGLDEVLDSSPNANFAVLTPKEFPNRGCQTSILVNNRGKELFNFLETNGIISDWREPNVIRIAPVPLYNTAEEVNLFIECLNAFYNSGS